MNKLKKILILCLTVLSLICFSFACGEKEAELSNSQSSTNITSTNSSTDSIKDSDIGSNIESSESVISSDNISNVISSATYSSLSVDQSSLQSTSSTVESSISNSLSYISNVGSSEIISSSVSTNSTSSSSSVINYGTLTIADIEVDEYDMVNIVPIFSIEEMAEEITYSFEGDNISITNGVVEGLVANTTTIVTATTTHHTATFTVTVNEIVYTKGLAFALNSDNTSYMVSIGTAKAKKIIIPSVYENLPVTKISNNGFKNSTITSVTIPDSVTSIGDYAFYDCDSLTSVTIPDSVTSIGAGAFYYCTSLTSVTIGDSVTIIGDAAFEYCSSLTSVTIPDSVTFIGNSAFEYCSSLTSVTIPDSVTIIGADAFEYCSSLISVTIPDSVTIIGWYAFYSCDSLTSVTIGDGVTSIGDYAFEYCSSLTSVTIGDSVTSIGSGAFRYCNKLVEIYNKSNLTITAGSYDNGYVGCYALNVYTPTSGASKLSTDSNGYIIYTQGTEKILVGYNGGSTKIVIPNGVTQIYERAFYNNDKITKVTIGESVTSIGSSAFYDCDSLIEIKYNATECIDLNSYNYVFYQAGQDGEGIKVIIGSNVKKIPAYLFYPSSYDSSYSPKITSLEFEENSKCESIGESAFEYCTSLTSLTIPDSVKNIGEGAFGCDNLQSLTIPFLGKSIAEEPKTYSSSFGWIFGGGCSGVAVQQVFPNGTLASRTFCYPKGLKEVTVTGEKIQYEAFYKCSMLTSITIGNSVTSIGERAFYYCTSLTSITIPDSVTSIGYEAFEYCTSLTEIKYNATECEDLFSNAFSNSGEGGEGIKVIIGANVKKIPAYLFYPSSSSNLANTPKITRVEFEEGSVCKSIGHYAFAYCSSLISVTIGDSVTSIGSSAFKDCYKLVEVYNKSNLTITLGTENNGYVGYYALNVYTDTSGARGTFSTDSNGFELYTYGEETAVIGYSEKSTEIVIPTVVTQINQRAFYNKNKITKVIIGDSVTSIGSYAFYNCDSLTEVKYNATECTDLNSSNSVFSNSGQNGGGIKVIIGSNVKKIPANLFRSSKITSLEFEEGTLCESIRDSAFEYCDSLTSVTIPDSVTSIGDYAFDDCDGLTSVTIGDSVTSIGDYAFYGCDSLTSVTIPDSVISIGDRAFYNCDSLTSVTIGDSVTSIGDSAFSGCFTLVEVYNKSNLSITTGSDGNGHVGYYALNVYTDTSMPSKLSTDSNGYIIYTDGAEKILVGYSGSSTEIVITNEVTQIYKYAFYYNDKITKVTISDSVTSIGNYAFDDCDGLTSVTIGDSVTSIGGYAFYSCSSLTSVTIPNSVTSIGYDPFKDCTRLQYNVENGLKYLGNSTNPYLYLAGTTTKSITTTTINSNCKFIGSYAFRDCTGLTSVTIGDSVTSIGYEAFYDCYKLVEVYNKSNLSITAGSSGNGYVGYYVLNVYTPTSGASKLSTDSNGYIIYTDGEEKILVGYIGDSTEIIIPNGITQIYKNAFYNNDKITSVTIGDSVTSIGGSVFYSCDSLTSVNYLGDINSWAQIEFDGCYANPLYYAKKLYINGEEVTSANITTATKISSYAFYNCNSVTSVTIGDSVTSIGKSAFAYCDSLTSVTIGDSVTSIGDYAFRGCSSLTSVTIGDSVTSIGSYAFSSCNSLTSVTFKNTSGWWCNTSITATSGMSISSSSLANTSTAATYLKSTYDNDYWKRNA